MLQWRLRGEPSGEGEAALHPSGHPAARLEVAGYLDVASVETLLASLSELVAEQNVTLLACDVRGLTRADLGTVDALARLQIGARRLGCPLVLCCAGSDLRALITILGLTQQLPELGSGPDR